MENSTDT